MIVSIGGRLLQIRKMKSLRQPEFAKLLGISESAYKNYETDKRNLPISLAIELCEKYEIDGNWLLRGIGAYRSEKIPEAFLKAKAYASKYIEKSDRIFDDAAISKLEAVFFQSLLEDPEQLEKELRLMHELNCI